MSVGTKSSPRKSLAAIVSNKSFTAREKMKYLFDSNQKEMSAFRVLYNLQVSDWYSFYFLMFFTQKGEEKML